jgi:hypothetical protein
MNRHERRKQAAISRADVNRLVSGARWSQRPDPEDPEYALIEFRMPTGPNRMPEATYVGDEAMARMHRFGSGFLAGAEDGKRERDEN